MYLTLIKHFLGNFPFKRLWRLFLLQYLILSEGKKAFEDILSKREADNERLPWKARSVEKSTQSLQVKLGLGEIEV